MLRLTIRQCFVRLSRSAVLYRHHIDNEIATDTLYHRQILRHRRQILCYRRQTLCYCRQILCYCRHKSLQTSPLISRCKSPSLYLLDVQHFLFKKRRNFEHWSTKGKLLITSLITSLYVLLYHYILLYHYTLLHHYTFHYTVIRFTTPLYISLYCYALPDVPPHTTLSAWRYVE